MKQEEVVALANTIMADVSDRAGRFLGLSSVILHPEIDPIKYPTLENACESVPGTIYINSDWLMQMLMTENFTEIRRMLYHEFRHQYQIQEVSKMQNGISSIESAETLQSWENEIFNPIRNDNAGNRTKYFLQTVEIDADAFALYFLDKDKEDGLNVQIVHEVPKEAESAINARKEEISLFYDNVNSKKISS